MRDLPKVSGDGRWAMVCTAYNLLELATARAG